jgi:BMFP domain-containing protein YqiC
LSNYYWDDRNNSNVLIKAVEEKKELESKVKELELRLASQKEKYDEMKEDLRDAKHRAQKAEWWLMKGTCMVM